MPDGRRRAETIATSRLDLNPLTPDDAKAMVDVLAASELYAFIGGRPPTLEALRSQYEHQAIGHSSDGTETWLNWIIRTRAENRAVGFVQATITDEGHDAVIACGRRPVATARLCVRGGRGARGMARHAWRDDHHGQRPPRPRRVGGGRPTHRPPAQRRDGRRRADVAAARSARPAEGHPLADHQRRVTFYRGSRP
jgi:hypothetical protein